MITMAIPPSAVWLLYSGEVLLYQYYPEKSFMLIYWKIKILSLPRPWELPLGHKIHSTIQELDSDQPIKKYACSKHCVTLSIKALKKTAFASVYVGHAQRRGWKQWYLDIVERLHLIMYKWSKRSSQKTGHKKKKKACLLPCLCTAGNQPCEVSALIEVSFSKSSVGGSLTTSWAQ